MLNALLFLPAALLLLGALGIVILRQTRPGIGYAWSIAALTTLLASAAVVVLRLRLPLQLSIDWWRPFAEYSTAPVLRLDMYSWPYALSLALIALAFILTDAARLETEAFPYNWAIGLALSALGILTVMAANPITLVFTWTAVDMVELILVTTSQAGRRMGVQTVTQFAVRVAGTLLVIVTVLLARSQQITFDLTSIPPNLALLLLLAAGLRLGVLPLNIPYTREVYALVGLGNVVRLMSPATSLVVLSRMPAEAVPPEWKGVLIVFAGLAALYGAGMWLASESEVLGRPYWMIAFSAFGIASVINGQPLSSIAWGLALLLPGSLLFFYTARRRQIYWLPLLGLIGILGLPYTPAASGWVGIFAPGAGFWSWVFWLSALFLAWGYFRHSYLRPRDELYRMERWVHTVFPGGLLFLAAGQWAASIAGWPGSFGSGVLWASLPLTLAASLGLAAFLSPRRPWARRAPAPSTVDPLTAPVPGTTAGEEALVAAVPSQESDEETGAAQQRWVDQFARRVGGVLAAVFRLNWLYRFVGLLYQFMQRIIELFTQMLEGDGGILWSLVMLALLFSLIWAGGTP